MKENTIERMLKIEDALIYKAQNVSRELKAIEELMRKEKICVRGWSAGNVEKALIPLYQVGLYEFDKR